MGDFNHSVVCWESNVTGCKQSRRLPECVENNFLVQILEKNNQRWSITGPDAHQCRLKRLRLDVVWDVVTML